MARRAVPAVALVALASLVACSGGGSSRSTSATSSPLRPARYAAPGPFATGVTTLHEADGRRVVVWYPADPGAVTGRPHDVVDLRSLLPADIAAKVPASAAVEYPTDAYRDVAVSRRGPFPLVLFSHGFGGAPEVYQFLTGHLASWGFVVAAPDHVERDLAAVFSGKVGRGDERAILLRSLDAVRADPRFGAAADVTRLVVAGHSSGTEAATDAASDPRVVAVALYSPDDGLRPNGKPTLVMVGADDHVTPAPIAEALYAALSAPKRLAVLAGAGHVTFTDGCALGAGHGGVPGLAALAGLTLPAGIAALAADGCQAGALPVGAAWPAIRDVTVAALRNMLGIDPTPIGLDAAALADLAPATVRLQQAP